MGRRIVVGITGASGAIYGIRLLEALRAASIETHAIISAGARATIEHETDRTVDEVIALASFSYAPEDLGASLASGTFLTDGMAIAPCSIRTLGAVRASLNDNLITRAADVHLKERRRLVLLVRETPLHAGHLRAMYDLSLYGATILPPIPAFYHRPDSLQAVIDHTVGKCLDQLGVPHELFARWTGLERH